MRLRERSATTRVPPDEAVSRPGRWRAGGWTLLLLSALAALFIVPALARSRGVDRSAAAGVCRLSLAAVHPPLIVSLDGGVAHSLGGWSGRAADTALGSLAILTPASSATTPPHAVPARMVTPFGLDGGNRGRIRSGWPVGGSGLAGVQDGRSGNALLVRAGQEPIVRANRRGGAAEGDPAAAGGEGGVPDFNKPIGLQYRFPTFFDETDFQAIIPHKYRLDVSGSEKVVRGRRETVMTYGGFVMVAMSAREVSALADDIPEGTFDLCVSTYGMRLESNADSGSFLYVLDDRTGMVVHKASMGTREYALHEPCFGKFSVKAMMEKVGVTRMTNGVLMSRPMAPPLLDVIECSWAQTGLIMTLAPLPAAPIKPGQTWTAGGPLLLSLYAVPKSSRYELEFKSFDAETGIAEVTWAGSLRGVNLTPQPGIHHIGEDAVANFEVTGSMRMHVASGRIAESSATIKSQILHLHARYPEVTFEMTFRLTPADVSPDALGGAGAGDAGAGGTTDGSRTVRRPRVPRDPSATSGSGGD